MKKLEYVKAEAETILLDGFNVITASGATRPGNGWGDDNHDHIGSPGHTGIKPGKGPNGTGAPGKGGR